MKYKGEDINSNFTPVQHPNGTTVTSFNTLGYHRMFCYHSFFLNFLIIYRAEGMNFT